MAALLRTKRPLSGETGGASRNLLSALKCAIATFGVVSHFIGRGALAELWRPADVVRLPP